jgi:hypothetical protein
MLLARKQTIWPIPVPRLSTLSPCRSASCHEAMSFRLVGGTSVDEARWLDGAKDRQKTKKGALNPTPDASANPFLACREGREVASAGPSAWELEPMPRCPSSPWSGGSRYLTSTQSVISIETKRGLDMTTATSSFKFTALAGEYWHRRKRPSADCHAASQFKKRGESTGG